MSTEPTEAPVPFLDLGAMTREVAPAVLTEWARLVEHNQFIGGAAVEEFERAWASYCGVEHAVGVANGTDAIVLALRAMGVGPGDEVVVPANTFVATAEAIVLAGARPRFADVDPRTLLITAATAAAALTPRTRAIVAVQLYGQPADMDAIRELADAHGIGVLEDAAQAHGATWNGRPVGSLGHAACFSFYPGKNLGAFGDGGAVVTDDAELAAEIRCLRDHGRAPGSMTDHVRIGTNSRLDSIQATVLSAKLPLLDRWNTARRSIVERYREAAWGSNVVMLDEAEGAKGVYHLAVALVTDRRRAAEVFSSLGVETRVHYPTPIHTMEPYRQWADGPVPNAEAGVAQILSLPMSPHLSDEQVERVCDAIRVVDAALMPDAVPEAVPARV